MNRLEKLKLEMAFNYPNVYEIVHMNADTPRLSGAEYLKHGFKAGFDAASAEYEKIIAELEGALKQYDEYPSPTDQVCCDNGVQVGEQEWSCCNCPVTLAFKALQKLKEFKGEK